MNESKILEYMEQYEAVHEEELEHLDAKRDCLTSEAREALARTIKRRSVSIDDLRTDRSKEQLGIEREELEIAKRIGERDRKLLKLISIISVPLVILGILRSPDSAWQTFVSTLVQVAIIGLIVWVVFAVKKKLRGSAKITENKRD